MRILDALWLGLIQALTEFLPVSSSGHLRLAHAWLGAEAPDDLLFDLLLHLGTLAAVVVIYRERLLELTRSGLAGLGPLLHGPRAALAAHEGLRMALLLIIATVPTGIIGVLLKSSMEGDFFGVPAVSTLLLLNGGVLWASRRESGRPGSDSPMAVAGIGPREALIIGIAQGIAVLPGISRSGMTIVTALTLGADRMRAAQFSFLLSIPAILGAVVLKLGDGPLALHGAATSYLIGTLTAAIGGAFALLLLLRMLREAQLHRFAWYCWALGAAGLISSQAG